MKGIAKMLSGQGGKEYGEQRRKFNEAIPDHFPAGATETERRAKHVAYSGSKVNTNQAADYKRAHSMHGPQSKQEHAAFEEYQRTHGLDGRLVEDKRERQSLLAWLVDMLLP